MSQLFVDNIKNRTGGAIGAPSGAVVTGVVTATSFVGDGTGLVGVASTDNIITGTAATFTGGINAAQSDVSVRNLTGVAATFTGVLTYEDVTNVDSVGIITARQGIRVGAGQSIGSTTATENVVYYGDGSKLTGVESGSLNFVASGTISNGATVIIKADGTVEVVAQSGSPTPNAGTPTLFEGGTGEINYSATTFDSNSNKIVIAYRDSSSPYPGKAVVGTVDGSTITFGSPATFETGQANYLGIGFDSNENKVVIAYHDDGDGQKGKAVVGTVANTSISFGTPVQFEAGRTQWCDVAYVSSATERVVIVYCDEDNNDYATVVVGNVSDDTISFGSPATWYGSAASRTRVVYDSNTDRVIVAWANGSSNGRAAVGTVSATAVTWGSTAAFSDAQVNGGPIDMVYSSTDQRVIISFRDGGNNQYGTARVGQITGGGTNSIAYGAKGVFESAGTARISSAYDSTNNKVLIAYRDEGNSNYGTAVIATVDTSDNSISFTTPLVFEDAAIGTVSAGFDSNTGKSVISYIDGGDSDKGKAVVFSSNSYTTNLTTENYIGIAAEAISNGATGKINIVGGVNTGQSSLTVGKTYYVQNNGSLATSAAIPSVVAGTSISGTKILIR